MPRSELERHGRKCCEAPAQARNQREGTSDAGESSDTTGECGAHNIDRENRCPRFGRNLHAEPAHESPEPAKTQRQCPQGQAHPDTPLFARSVLPVCQPAHAASTPTLS